VSNGTPAAIRWRAKARQIGTWGPVPATGREVTWEGVYFVTVEDGWICHIWALGDTFEKARQLGVRFQSPCDAPDDSQST
jgi:predicted ester cyclase